jgi:hypothetical protein
MKKHLTFTKHLMMLVLVLGIGTQAMAQAKKRTVHKYVCDNNANRTLDLGLEVMGEVLSKEGGIWEQLDAVDGNVMDTGSEALSNIFNMVGLLPGEYVFRYTAVNNVCLAPGNTRTAVIHIIETPKDFDHTVFVCSGESPKIDLSTLIAPKLKTYTPVFTLISGNGEVSGSELTITDNFREKEVISVDYSLTLPDASDDSIGAEDKLSCSSATISILVDRSGDAPNLTVSEVTYCLDTKPETLNLNQFAASSVAGAKTSWVDKDDNVVPNGIVDLSSVSTATDLTFTYKWDDTPDGCFGTGSAPFTIKIVSDLPKFTETIEENICKSDNPNRVYNLMVEGLGMDLPTSGGVWREVSREPENLPEIDVTEDGMFRVSEARSGKYTYEYRLSSANEGICGLKAGDVYQIAITVGDVGGSGVLDGRVQICGEDLEKGGSFKLSDYIAGLGDLKNVTWRTTTGADISGDSDNEVAYSELKKLGFGTHLFEFDYISDGCGGKNGTGSLYVTVTDNLEIPENIALEYCRPEFPESLQLNQVVGVDLIGKGEWAKVGDDDTFTLNTNGVLTVNDLGSGEKTITVKFTPAASSGGCDIPTITVSITIVDNF